MKTPKSPYYIRELAAVGRYDEAQAACEENEKFFEARADEMRDLYVEVEAKKKAEALGGEKLAGDNATPTSDEPTAG